MSFNFGSGSGGSGGDKKAFNFGGFTSPTLAASTPAVGSVLPAPNMTAPGLFGSGGTQPPEFGGFGTSQPQTSQPTAGLSLSFGAAVGTSQASGFGQPAAASATAAPAPTGLTFGSPSGGGGFAGFKTPASGFSALPQPAPVATSAPAYGFGGTPPAATTGLSFGAGVPGGLSFAPAATASAALNFGAPGAPPGAGALNFGAPSSTATPAFGSPSAISATTTGLSFGAKPAAPTATPSTGLSFGATTTAGGLNFGTPATTGGLSFAPTSAAGLSFGTLTTSGGVGFGTGGLNFGSAATAAPVVSAPLTATPGLCFGSTPASTTPSSVATHAPGGFSLAPASTTPGLTLGTPATTTAATPGFGTAAPVVGLGLKTAAVPASTAASSFGSGKKASTDGLTGFCSSATSAPSSTAATSLAPSGITALGQQSSTAQTTSILPASTTTMTATLAPPQAVTSLTFAQLEDIINKCTLQLEEQEKLFINQATQINAWDRLLIENGEKIVELNEAVQTACSEQQAVEHELEFIEAQQRELEDLLAPLERDLAKEQRGREPEREHMYQLAETLDTQLKQITEDLKEVIQHLNETSRSQDGNDPIVQISRILNAHVSSMQWVDNSIAQISTKLDQLKSTHDALRRDNERSFQLTYN